MKKYQIFLTLTALAILAAAIIGLALFFQNTKDTTPNGPDPLVPRQTQGQVNFTSKPPASQENSETQPESVPAARYVIREYGEHIGVFADGSDTPLQEIDVLISSLPPSDRALLKKGIPAQNEVQLRSLLEDYS